MPPPPISTLFPYTTLFRSHNYDSIRMDHGMCIKSTKMKCDYAEKVIEPPCIANNCRSFHVDSSLDRKSTRLNSSHVAISYAVFCLKKKRQDICQKETIRSS